MGPYLLGKQTSCWWRHETMGNIYYVEFNFLNLKCYVFKMFLPNFNRIEWKMEKQQLFQNRLFLALFILTWEKYDVIVTSLLIWFGFFHRKLFILSESISVQNLSSLTLKTKELWKGGWKTPPPPQCYNETKKPSAYRVNWHFGPYGKYLFWHSRRMDLTAFGPYALNVRTNISSYGPRARLIRAYLYHINLYKWRIYTTVAEKKT